MNVNTCSALAVDHIDTSGRQRPFVAVGTNSSQWHGVQFRIFNLDGDKFAGFVRLVELWSLKNELGDPWVSRVLPDPSTTALRLSWEILAAQTELLREVREALDGIVAGRVSASMVSSIEVHPRASASGLKIECPEMLVSNGAGAPAAFSDAIDFVLGIEKFRLVKWRDSVVMDEAVQKEWEAERMKENVRVSVALVLKAADNVADELAKFRRGLEVL